MYKSVVCPSCTHPFDTQVLNTHYVCPNCGVVHSDEVALEKEEVKVIKKK